MKYLKSERECCLKQYKNHLLEQERSGSTIGKYIHDITKFLSYLGDEAITKNLVMAFKEDMVQRYAPASVNAKIAAVNGFLEWLGLPLCKVKPLKIQKNMFSKPEKELNHREYARLIQAAEQGKNQRLSLLIQTICATGIRVSELEFITVASLQIGRSTVSCKGKNRTIFLPKDLCRALKKYCRAHKITTGSVFVSKSGNALNRSNIWKMMKGLCKMAGVAPEKVFPHNLRHLFARTYYKIEKDISKLADILGHSSINTTRIYTMETGTKHAKQMEKMKLLYIT